MIIWVNYEKTKGGPFLWNTVYFNANVCLFLLILIIQPIFFKMLASYFWGRKLTLLHYCILQKFESYIYAA